MTMPLNLRRIAAAGFAAVLSLALAACFVLPGKFAETLDLRKDGRFTYSYKGEILVLGLTKLMDMAKMGEAGQPAFEPTTCFDEKKGEERECTKAEIAEQKAVWEEDQKNAAKSEKERGDAMTMLMGGIDPNDPKAGEELAARLRKQAGWRTVTYKGDGVYEVDFTISSRLDHDFAFPSIERMAAVTPFLVINRRADGTVRINSPIMEDNSGAGAKSLGMGSLAAGMAASGDDGKNLPGIPKFDGTFTLTSDAAILANNTEDGPKVDPAGQRLEWKMNIQNPAAPMALLQLAK
ncbi:MAG: hypothetical protein ABL914_04240 [Novosphingobium sp.]|uniref:hypothetical protein n=1 Tax=Novosphingobium sp. TaxID=1874826 RepID=UPI0032BB3EDE